MIPDLLESETEAASAFSTVARLRDGGLIRIRAIRPEDKKRLLDHFSRLSPTSVYQRFFGVKKTLTPEELKRFTELDFTDAVGLAATLGEGKQEVFVGVGRYVVVDPRVPRGSRRAEMAFAVADEQQGRGIATQLLAQLLPFARRNGIAGEAEVLSENIHMLHVFARIHALREQVQTGLRRPMPYKDGIAAPRLQSPGHNSESKRWRRQCGPRLSGWLS